MASATGGRALLPAFLFGACSAVLVGRVARRRLFGTAAAARTAPPPRPKVKQGKSVAFGHVEGENRGDNPMNPPKMYYDPLFWLRDDDRKDEDVIGHLKAENDYFAAQTNHLKPLAASLYKDLLSHVKETDESVPYPFGPYLYYTRTVEGLSYRVYCRKKKGSDSEEVLLDMNELAKGKKHCDLGCFKVSPDHSILAYSLDENGYESYQPYFLDLTTRKALADTLPEISGSMCWGKNNDFVYYSKHDEAHRPYQLWRHKMGTAKENDTLLYEENDEEYWLGFFKSHDGRFLFCEVGTKEESEYRFIDLHNGDEGMATMKLFHGREDRLRYDVEHHEGRFIIVTNADGAKNQKVMICPVDRTAKDHWKDMLPYEPARCVEGHMCLASQIVIVGRENGFSALWLLDPQTAALRKLEGFPEPVSTVGLGANKDYDTSQVRIVYDSLVTPPTTFDVDIKTMAMTRVHVKPVPEYDASQYVSKQLFTTGHDGTRLPMSLVYKKGSVFDKGAGPGPIFLDGYGSYGVCNEPSFASTYIPLLDRGICVVHAHIRGGSEMGRHWYEDEGKFLAKKNTFHDFISCAEHLIKEKWTSSDLLAIHGRSAGGLLMGNVLNMAPHLFKCCLAGVPFVDLMNTMSDPSIPLTCAEWQEWGNPNEEKFHTYMQSYCPYSNVTAQNYPAIMVLAGLYDPRVAYWEPAKWVARLRERKTDDNIIVLKTDLDSGHFSASDRYKYLREKSMEFAFVCDQLGAKDHI